MRNRAEWRGLHTEKFHLWLDHEAIAVIAAAWAGCCEALFIMPWALRGISAGAMMSTEILDDVDDEAKSLSRMSSIMLICRM